MSDAFVTINPYDGAILERFTYFSEQEIEDRLSQAMLAAQAWGAESVEMRAGFLGALARQLRMQRENLARIATQEMGKPLTQARAEIDKCAWACEFFANDGPTMLAEHSIPTEAQRSIVAFRPLGVILAIMPWNFPYWQIVRAAIPALLAGNTVLLKHSESTTRCGLAFEQLLSDAGAAAGVFSTLVVSSDRADALIADSRIAAVTLTGSERAGIAVGTAAGGALKPCVLELGGSDAFIVLADANLERAIETAVDARFQNSGQSCIAAKRFIVEAPLYDAFLARFVAKVKALRIGNPSDEATQIGPMARADLLQTLQHQVHASLESGARLILGGRPMPRTGNFYEPTVVADVTVGMRMWDEETFGPAAAIVKARDPEHAMQLANMTAFGLSASIWTNDLERARRMAQHLQCGSVFVNAMVKSDPRLPFGGTKHSGFGRELGTFGVRAFVNVQTLWEAPIP